MSRPDRAQILERERRWARPVGIAALAGVVLVAIGVALRISALTGDGAAEALTRMAEDDLGSRLLIGSILYGLGLILCAAALTYLFIAARDRSERVRSGMIGLAIVGAVAFLIGGPITATAIKSGADDFVEAEQAREADPPADEGGGANAEETTTEATNSEATNSEETTSTTSTTDEEESDEEDDPDERASDAIGDAPGYSIGGLFGLIAVLAFSIGYLYTSLWAMRTGLLSRFWGSLGMAAAVAFALIAQAQAEVMLFQEIWFVALGLIILNKWPRARPPAWDAGREIPWAAPGMRPDDREETDPGLIEGEGRDISGTPTEDQIPPDGDSAPNGTAPPPSGPPRKRKRRQ